MSSPDVPASEPVAATKQCPFCAETILEKAKKCRYCGEFLDAAAPVSWHQKRATMRAFGITGSLLLAIAPFAPVATAPVLGRITLFAQGKGDGVFLVLLAVAGLACTLADKYWFLWFSGGLGLLESGNMLHFFWFRLPQVLEQYRAHTAGNPFASIGEMMLGRVDADWGSAALALGTVFSLIVAVGHKPSSAMRLLLRVFLPLAAFFIVYKLFLEHWLTLLIDVIFH